MKAKLLVFFVAWAAACGQEPGAAKPEELSSIEGKVVDVRSGGPLSKVQVTLVHSAMPINTTEINRGFYSPVTSGVTDQAGEFLLKDIPPGSYRLRFERMGFVGTEYGSGAPTMPGTVLRFGPAQKMTAIEVKMTPHSAISGRILDEDKEAVANVNVVALRYRNIGARPELAPFGSAQTNDLGEYRIFGLPPGRYYLTATYRESPAHGETAYLPTYYPSGLDPAAAVAIEVGPGAQIGLINITLAKARTLRLYGRVINQTGVAPAQAIRLVLRPVGRPQAVGIPQGQVSGPENQFEVRGVPPGSYNLVGFLRGGESTYVGQRRIDVGSRDLEADLVIGLPVQVPGDVKVDDEADAAKAKLSSLEVLLRHSGGAAAVMMGPEADAKVKEDGTFTLENVNPDLFVVHLAGLPDGFYIKSIYHGNEEAMETDINLLRGVAPIHVVISGKAGAIDGSVQRDGKAFAGAVVAIVPESPGKRLRPRFYKDATTDQYGRFSIKNIDPGDYQIYAWERIGNREWMNAEVMEMYSGKGTKITIKPAGRDAVQLSLIEAQ